MPSNVETVNYFKLVVHMVSEHIYTHTHTHTYKGEGNSDIRHISISVSNLYLYLFIYLFIWPCSFKSTGTLRCLGAQFGNQSPAIFLLSGFTSVLFSSGYSTSLVLWFLFLFSSQFQLSSFLPLCPEPCSASSASSSSRLWSYSLTFADLEAAPEGLVWFGSWLWTNHWARNLTGLLQFTTLGSFISSAGCASGMPVTCGIFRCPSVAISLWCGRARPPHQMSQSTRPALGLMATKTCPAHISLSLFLACQSRKCI